MSDKKPTRGFQGAVLKLLRAGDYRLTVTGKREVSPHYVRLSFDAGGMLADRPLHPTMWIRMWFADGDKLHQRGYTLVDPNPAADTVDIEFALHDGIASHWAENAQPGDTVEVTVLGSNFTLPEPSPAVLLDDPVDVLDAEGKPVRVTSRGMFSADPVRLESPGHGGDLSWWTGPWPVDERWWDTASAGSGRTARAQVLFSGGDRQEALLLCYRQRRWYLEGRYE